MASQSLEDRCYQIVQDLAREKGWQFPPEGIEALAAAILPFVQRASDSGARMIRTIALNYYQEGPMVQQMLAKGSADGERLWGEWRNYFARVARGRGIPDEGIENVAQDTWIQSSRALHTFRFESQLKSFLSKVCINCCHQWFRAKVPIELIEVPLEREGPDGEIQKPDIPGKSPSPEALVLKQEQNAEIKKLVEKEIGKIVKSEDFQILYWYYVDETYIDENTREKKKWTDRAIGERLGMSLSAVTARRWRARKRILEYVRDHPGLGEKIRELLGLDTEDTDE